MKLFRDERAPWIEALEASEGVLKYPASIVLKDYWLSQLLRELRSQYPVDVVFKGGTSLSKGWDLIHRMSEDVDLLVVREAGQSRSRGERRLVEMVDGLASALGLDHEVRDVGYGRLAHRSHMFAYEDEGFPLVGVDPAGVLLELGYGDGLEPKEVVTIAPMVAKLVPDAADYYDLAPVRMQALTPARTLTEKLHGLHNIVTEMAAGNAPRDERRIGRHYYDIHRCLEHTPTRKVLEGRAAFGVMVASVERISRDHFGSKHARPAGGYAASIAFNLDEDAALRARIAALYEQSKELMRIDMRGSWPSLDAVLEQIAKHADLL